MSEPVDPSLIKHPFWHYIRRNPRPVAVGISLLVVTDILDGLWPLLLKEGIDRITAGVEFGSLGRVCLVFFALMTSLALSRYGWRVSFGRYHTLAAENLRTVMFRHLSKLTPSFLGRKPVGELMSLLTNDVQSFRQGIGDGFLVFTDGVVILAVVVPLMLHMNVRWTLWSLAFLPLVPLMIWWVMRKIHATTLRQQDAFARVTAHSQESVAGVRVVKGFALEKVRLNSFNVENRLLEKATNDAARIDALFMPVMEFGVTAGTVAFLFAAKDDLISGVATVGTFVAFHRFIMKTVWPMTALGMGLSQLQKGFASFERIKDLLTQKPDLQSSGEAPLDGFQALEFRNVGFKYPGTDAWVFRGVNFRLTRGQSLGVAGPVAAGKTTLMALLTRQYDPSEGEILLNGRPLRDFPLDQVRGCFALVPQDVFLFSDTVTENIGFGIESGFTDAAAEAAARQVDIHDEIRGLPEGYASLVGEKGVNLSGGQKQRMALARGLVLGSPVLLLDDVLSAVDTRTEHRIESVLLGLRHRGQTQVLIAHRLSTLAACDVLLILHDGTVESFGPREQVLRDSAFLARLRQIQDQPEALA